jgi:hypothetical protein
MEKLEETVKEIKKTYKKSAVKKPVMSEAQAAKLLENFINSLK